MKRPRISARSNSRTTKINIKKKDGKNQNGMYLSRKTGHNA